MVTTSRLGSTLAVVVLVVVASSCATTSTTARAAPLPGAWRLVFADDFEGDALGPQWHTCHWWQIDGGCRIGSRGEQQWYRPEAVQVGAGALRLTASAEPQPSPDGVLPYRSGMVATGRRTPSLAEPLRFGFTYGYVEARLRLPAAPGAWPAVWLLSTDCCVSGHPSLSGIDIMEWHGSRPTRLTSNVHQRVDGARRSRRVEVHGADRSGRWVVVGADWTPTRVTFYVDGRMTGWVNDPALVPDTPMYLVVNLAVDGDVAHDPAPEDYPADLLVDYVRVWQHYGEESR